VKGVDIKFPGTGVEINTMRTEQTRISNPPSGADVDKINTLLFDEKF
jgi:hypothetical protein